MSRDKAGNVVRYWVLCEELKEVVRSGWKLWKVEQERLESVAEHIYGTQMLAIAMWSEYGYEVDIAKVCLMLALHELEEVRIGDLTPFDKASKTKMEMGHEAVCEILKDFGRNEEIVELIFEFDARETAEARFAFMCDKMEAVLQAWLYDKRKAIDLTNQGGNPMIEDEIVKKYLDDSHDAFELFMAYADERYGICADGNFREVGEYMRGSC